MWLRAMGEGVGTGPFDKLRASVSKSSTLAFSRRGRGERRYGWLLELRRKA